MGPIVDEAAELLRSAYASAERMIRLTDNLLDLRLIEEGAAALHLEQCDLAELVDVVIAETHGLAAEQNVRLTSSGRRGHAVLADRDRMAQILSNLITNAVRFTAVGGEVELEMARAGDYAMVTVLDRGPGVDADDQERIFKRFERAAAAPNGHRGSGLGLPVSRALAGAQGGVLTYTSRAGGGSRFTLSVPIVRQGASKEDGRAVASPLRR